LVKLVGKVKTFSFGTGRFCKNCGNKVVFVSSSSYRCPECGILDWTKYERLWFAILSLDVIDIDVRVFFLNKALPGLMSRIGISWQMCKDRLSGLRGESWLQEYKEIKNEIESEANVHFVGQVIVVNGKMGKNNTFLARRLGETARPNVPTERLRFVEGKLDELNAITQKLLSDYRRDVELWENTPVIRFTKFRDGVDIEIGIRAPLEEYAKSYRVWMRVNDVHMYPAEPVRVGKGQFAWVLRTYHTKGWKEQLERILEHCTSLETQALAIFNAAKKLNAEQIEQILEGLPSESIDQIQESWHGGTVWDLAKTASKIDRAAGIHVLRKFGLLGTYDTVKGSNTENSARIESKN
jgi:hypothetical protein